MKSALDLIRDFDDTLEDSVGLYLDSLSAMVSYAKHLQNIQNELSISGKYSLTEIDAAPYSYGKGDPNNPNSLHLHTVNMGALKARVEKNGRNCILLEQRFIIDIYAYWEDSYRLRIAEALGVSRSTILSDIFGDIRLIRNSIIHHRGIALADVEKCKILNWFKEGDLIRLSPPQFETIVVEVRNWLENFGKEKTGFSPNLAGRWGPSGHRHIGPE